jgi:hypothetical protein
MHFQHLRFKSNGFFHRLSYREGIEVSYLPLHYYPSIPDYLLPYLGPRLDVIHELPRRYLLGNSA